jgi:hypothetical protein
MAVFSSFSWHNLFKRSNSRKFQWSLPLHYARPIHPKRPPDITSLTPGPTERGPSARGNACMRCTWTYYVITSHHFQNIIGQFSTHRHRQFLPFDVIRHRLTLISFIRMSLIILTQTQMQRFDIPIYNWRCVIMQEISRPLEPHRVPFKPITMITLQRVIIPHESGFFMRYSSP